MKTTFCDQWQELSWDSFRQHIHLKTAKDVEHALQSKKRNLDDFLALISPVAEPYLEQMAKAAQTLTRQRFGNVVGLYVPLYLSNLCTNNCTYCGFSMHNKIKRKLLNADEIMAECAAIKALGYEHLLLVTGEYEHKVGMDYFRQHLPAIRSSFSSVLMEVQPLLTEDYRSLKQLGLDGVLVYQETYNHEVYKQHHLSGSKQDFFYRLETPDRLGSAEIDKIGLGVLLGLSDDWRTDIAFLANHYLFLQKKYWKSRFSISFPRLRPCVGQSEPASNITDRQLVQLICAFRLLSPELELSLSTRESAHFRDHTIPLAINTISADSQTQPGGYANKSAKQELEQFEIHDKRTGEEVATMLMQKGLEPVWKDWNRFF